MTLEKNFDFQLERLSNCINITQSCLNKPYKSFKNFVKYKKTFKSYEDQLEELTLLSTRCKTNNLKSLKFTVTKNKAELNDIMLQLKRLNKLVVKYFTSNINL